MAVRSWDTTLAFLAVVAASIAATAAVWSNLQQRQHLVMSARPHLGVGFGMNKEGSGWTVHNPGPGPAFVEWMQVTVDGKRQRDWPGVFEALELPRPAHAHPMYLHQGSVLPAGFKKDLFWIDTSDAADMLSRRDVSTRVDIRVCYCSAYDECWQAVAGAVTPPVLDTCETRPPGIPFGGFVVPSPAEPG